ncbi:hypothetical protein R5R35_005894 [Gryllus longicercus]|uniref:Acylphosphatase n=2 Tax=Gryllus longicercus TaxID=2509291 RepID=A0AAN9VHQ4_9ORTH
MPKECSNAKLVVLEKESPTHSDEQSENTATMASREIIHVEFEVYGKVQGVFFRKNTVDQASKLKLKGWCMNTPSGTVKGAMEGDAASIREMKHWLANVGSKMSRIDKAEFRNEKSISTFTFPNFSVRH